MFIFLICSLLSVVWTTKISGHIVDKLNHQWANRGVRSDLAKTISTHQSKCTDRVQFFGQKNFGMGSDMHVWSQALCNSMQSGSTLVQLSERWIWNDLDFCGSANNPQPLSCYFNLRSACLYSEPISEDPVSHSNKMNQCPSFIHDGESRQAFRAAAMEYLFSNLSTALIADSEKAIASVFGSEGIPENLITLHMRLGDKATEMKLVTEAEYVAALDKLIEERAISEPHIYITTESMDGLEKLKEGVLARKKGWKIHYHLPAIFDSKEVTSPMGMAAHSKGAIGRHSLIALLLALEARYYVLTSGSNWSRLIDELRRNVVDVDCGNCTQMVDLREAVYSQQNWRL